MPSLTIRLPEHARSALQDLAEVQCRTPRDQAAFLILEGLRASKPTTVDAAAQGRRTGPGSRKTRVAAPAEVMP